MSAGVSLGGTSAAASAGGDVHMQSGEDDLLEEELRSDEEHPKGLLSANYNL